MLLILRGHIRDSFNNSDLYNLIKSITQICNLTIYIHTWNIFSNNLSWREINFDNNVVNKDVIYDYFKDLKVYIKEIIIDDDSYIILQGSRYGYICNTLCKKLGWKRYLFSKYRIIKHIIDNVHDYKNIINMRFDIMCNSFSISSSEIYSFINNNMDCSFYKNKFIFDSISPGIDNIYIGTVYTMYVLLNHFHYNLDKINDKYIKEIHQEFLLFYENDELDYIKKINIINDVFYIDSTIKLSISEVMEYIIDKTIETINTKSTNETDLVKDNMSTIDTELESKENKIKLTKSKKSTKLKLITTEESITDDESTSTIKLITKEESITDDESTSTIKLIKKEESTIKTKNEKIIKNKSINSLPVRSKIPLDIPNMICDNNKSNIKKNIKPIIKKRTNKNQITLEEHRSLEV
jgi:hypothetical protein